MLAGDDIGALVGARALARETLAILRANRRWALAYNVIAMPLAACGFVPPWLAALGMSASSLGVVLNALRIGRGRRADRLPRAARAPREALREAPHEVPREVPA